MLVFSRILQLLAGILIALGLYSMFRDIRSLDCLSLQTWMRQWGGFAPLIFCLVYSLASLGFFPGVLLTLTAGMIFGIWWGTLLVLVSATLSACLMFFLARHVARKAIEKRLSQKKWFATFCKAVQDNSIRYIIFVRLIPLFPYNGINLASGLTAIRVRDFVIGSFLGMLPGTFAFVYMGETGCLLADPLSRGDIDLSIIPVDVLLTLGLLILLLAALSIAPLIIRRWQDKKKGVEPR